MLNQIKSYIFDIFGSPVQTLTLILGIFTGICLALAFTVAFPINVVFLLAGVFSGFTTWYTYLTKGSNEK